MDEIERIGGPYPWPAPPGIGTRVELNSRGPVMLVVDVGELEAHVQTLESGRLALSCSMSSWFNRVCAWRDGGGMHELTLDWRMLKPASSSLR